MSDPSGLDPVTGSGGEALLLQRYREIAAQGRGDFALLSLKLKRFNHLNRVYGRAVGDQVLRGAYAQLCAQLEPDECCVRLRSGYFNLLVRMDCIDTVHRRTISLITALRDNSPCPQVAGHLFSGVGVYQIPAQNPPDFHVAQYNADLCRQGSAQAGYRNSHYEIYGYSFRNPSDVYFDLQDEILPALEKGHFQLYLQPKVDLLTGRVLAAEGLMRWIDPVRGMIPLGSFLPGLEESGLIRKVDLYLFEEACRLLARWRVEYGQVLQISVNLSKAYFEDNCFVEDYNGVLRRYQVLPHQLIIEFLESIVMDKVDEVEALITQVHQVGMACALDDFGSGYSSFNVLAGATLDELKIDRSLLSNPQNQREQVLLRHIIATASALGMQVVAEGVEDPAYLPILREMGCDQVQGYVFYRPMSSLEFEHRFLQGGEQITPDW